MATNREWVVIFAMCRVDFIAKYATPPENGKIFALYTNGMN